MYFLNIKQDEKIEILNELTHNMWDSSPTSKELRRHPAILLLYELAIRCLQSRSKAHLNLVMALETLAKSTPEIGPLFSICAHIFGCLMPILKFGHEKLKDSYTEKFLNGELIGGIAITEPKSGSDITNLNTFYSKIDDGYTISGEKTMITNATEADLFVLFARNKNLSGQFSLSAFIVDDITSDRLQSERLNLIGLKGGTIGELIFSNYIVPHNAILCKEGSGIMIFNYAMQYERTFMVALSVGTMTRQLSLCIDFAKKRKQYGKTIASFQSVSNRIVDMKVRLEASRLLLYNAAYMLDEGKMYSPEASIAKLFISESSLASSIDAFRTIGSKGALIESEMGGDIFDALLSTIYSGTSDIQRFSIAKHLGLN